VIEAVGPKEQHGREVRLGIILPSVNTVVEIWHPKIRPHGERGRATGWPIFDALFPPTRPQAVRRCGRRLILLRHCATFGSEIRLIMHSVEAGTKGEHGGGHNDR
jgi:hypothetical protein